MESKLLKFLKLDKITEHLSDYIETKLELIKLEVREELAQRLAFFMVYASIFFVFSLAVVFASLGLANWLNVLLESVHLGYWIVCGIYLLISLILFLIRKHPAIVELFMSFLNKSGRNE